VTALTGRDLPPAAERHLVAPAGNPQLRTVEGQTAQARFGDQVPVPVTTFSPSRRGVAQQPVTSFRVQERGVTSTSRRACHHDGEVI